MRNTVSYIDGARCADDIRTFKIQICVGPLTTPDSVCDRQPHTSWSCQLHDAAARVWNNLPEVRLLCNLFEHFQEASHDTSLPVVIQLLSFCFNFFKQLLQCYTYMSSKLSVAYGTLNLSFLTNCKLIVVSVSAKSDIRHHASKAKQSKAKQAKPHIVQR